MSRSKATMSGPLLPYVEGLRSTLTARGYAPGTLDHHERLLGRLSGWLQAQGLGPSAVTVDVVDRFVAAEQADRCSPAGSVRGLSTVLAFLRAEGVVPAAAQGPVEVVLTGFGSYLRGQRRLAPLTVVNRCVVVRRFLLQRAGDGGLDLAGLAVSDVHAFVLAEASRLRRGSISAVLDAMRSFLRYLFATGVTAGDLSACLPSVVARRPPSLPRAVDAATLSALLVSCDRRSPVGLRDYAILTVMSRLGLRANEIAGMRLDDLDWRAGELVVHSKGGATDRLPLPPDVGRALVAYLRRGRPATASRAVFLRAGAPTGPLSRNGVVFVPRNASARAGVAVVGAHRLRHTAASRMLQAGASLREVGQVLRHDRDQTTALYAHVDPRVLAQVVRAWPGSPR